MKQLSSNNSDKTNKAHIMSIWSGLQVGNSRSSENTNMVMQFSGGIGEKT